jgi:hypothetical protein
MNFNNVNIGNIAKNSDPNQRAMILFNDFAKQLITGKQNLKESERDTLDASFKTNEEARIYNKYFHFFDKAAIALLEIEKCFNKAEYFKCMVVDAFVNIGDKKDIIDQTIATFDEILSQNLVAKGKEKEFFATSIKLIANLQNSLMPEFIYKMHEKARNDQTDDEEIDEVKLFKAFVKTINNRMKEQLEIITGCQEILKVKYQEFGVKFSDFDDRIKQNDADIEKLKDFIDNFCGTFSD